MNIAIIYGSVRPHRQGIKAAKFFEKQLEARKHNVTLIDPIKYKLPLLEKMYKEYDGDSPEMLATLHTILDDADGFIIVSGEYNHSVPPALKNLLDHFQKEYFFKPSALVTYSAGGFGGVRNLANLRAIVAELGMPSISSHFPIPKVQDVFDDEGNTLDDNYNKRVNKFLAEFEWYATAMKEGRKKGTPY